MQNEQISEIKAIYISAEKLRVAGKNDEAIREYTRVVYVFPRHWPAYFHLGVLFGESGRDVLAVAMLQRALSLNPKNAVIHNHLGDILLKQEHFDEALRLFKQSWSLDSGPGNVSAAVKIGKLYREMNQLDKAIGYFNIVLLGEDKENINADIKHVSRWFRGLCKLAKGEYLDAWEDYESRVNVPGVFVPTIPGELWQGQPLENKTIFLAYEQRFGDVIQFVRFIPRLNAMGAHVIIQTPPELERQLQYLKADVELVSTSSPLPDYDYHQFVTSIPAILNLTLKDITQDKVPYLGVDESVKQAVLPMRNDTHLRVGLIWAGKPEPDRSIALTSYIPLLSHREVSFYSFQLGERSNDLKAQSVAWLINDLSPKISDFYDSSALLTQMDLFVTIDTAAAHQAGALGVSVWLMLRYFSDWRWMINRDDNLWYPSMRLFRQAKEGCWDEASKQLELAFADWVEQTIATNCE